MIDEIEIKFLADCDETLPDLASLWYEEIGKKWIPGASISKAEANYRTHANKNQLPLTVVALSNNRTIGMCSLREDDGLGNQLTPWLGSLIVHPDYRRQRIGEKLIEKIYQQALAFGYPKLYILVLDPTLPMWYSKLGFSKIGDDNLLGHPVTVMESKILTNHF